MAISAILLFLLLVESSALSSPIKAHQISCPHSPTNRASLLSEIREAKFKLAQLESNLEKSIQDLNGKSLNIKECEKKIEEMNLDTHLLKTDLASLENDSSQANAKLSALEGELQLLWSTSRKNNFEIHTLEYRAQDAEKRLDMVKSQVEGMAEIVSEQWIQIQQLEQAVQMAQFRALKVKRQLRAARCPFIMFMKNVLGEHVAMLNWILDPYVYGWVSTLESCISEASGFLKRTFSAAKHYHHQGITCSFICDHFWLSENYIFIFLILQGYIKQSMLRNEITAVLAHEEVVFFVASVLVSFPVLSIFMLFSSRLV